MLKHLLNQTATIMELTDSSLDQYDNPERVYLTLGDFPCRLEGWKGRELEVNRDTRITYLRLYLDELALGSVSSTSTVVIDDVTYDVWGDPLVFHRRSQVNHIECILRRIEG